MPINYDPTRVQRLNLTPVYMSLGAFFIAKTSDIIEQNTRSPLPTFNYCLDSFESIEIDYLISCIWLKNRELQLVKPFHSPPNLLAMNIIDVTLRDGGHQVDFDWPDEFAKLHIDNSIKCSKVNFVGWAIGNKPPNLQINFITLNEQSLEELNSGEHCYSNYSVMVDCHYCSHKISDYPSRKT